MTTKSTIQFIRRGQPVSLSNVPPSRTLLEVLREDLGATGTKEGCGEGDCGACTVVIGELSSKHGQTITYRAVNSCIRMAHSVHGKALWTVEDLTRDPLLSSCRSIPGAPLHPAQEAMVRCHGSQCGFCTPGFVMSLFALDQHRAGQPVTREQAQVALSGNLCRCTGYRPILDSAVAMAELPPVTVDEAALGKQLKALARHDAEQAVHADAPYLQPRTLDALLRLRQARPQAQIVAGATDVALWVTKGHRRFEQVLDLSEVRELKRVERYRNHSAIGAAVKLSDAFTAMVAERPALRRFTERFAGLPVRESGTLGGNVANGSPIGDSMPLLIALGAHIVLMRAGKQGQPALHRELPLEDLYTGYRQNVMRPDEVVAWIKLPHPNKAEFMRVYKVSKRYDDDISAVCLALRLERDRHGHVSAFSVGVGGVAATPVRARKTEAAVRGQPWNKATLARAQATLGSEFQPISDMRASAAYRQQLLGNLLQRFWLESQGGTDLSLDSLTHPLAQTEAA